MAGPATKLVSIAAAAALVVLAAGPAAACRTPDPAGNPLLPGARLYVNPHSTTAQAAATLRGTYLATRAARASSTLLEKSATPRKSIRRAARSFKPKRRASSRCALRTFRRHMNSANAAYAASSRTGLMATGCETSAKSSATAQATVTIATTGISTVHV